MSNLTIFEMFEVIKNNQSNFIEFDFSLMKMKINNKEYNYSFYESSSQDNITFYSFDKEDMKVIVACIMKLHKVCLIEFVSKFDYYKSIGIKIQMNYND